MFSTYLGELKGYVGKAFVLAVWLPVFVFASLGMVIYLEGSGSLGSAWQRWNALTVGGQGVLAMEFLIAVTFKALGNVAQRRDCSPSNLILQAEVLCEVRRSRALIDLPSKLSRSPPCLDVFKASDLCHREHRLPL